MMSRFVSAVVLFLTSFLVHAQEDAVATQVQAPADSDPTAMIVFALLLVGSIVWYGWFIYSKEKQRKQQELAAK